jgi:hypothetical protein
MVVWLIVVVGMSAVELEGALLAPVKRDKVSREFCSRSLEGRNSEGGHSTTSDRYQSLFPVYPVIDPALLHELTNSS